MADVVNPSTPVSSDAVRTQRPKKDNRVSMWIALLSAAGAVAAAVVASVQVHVASQQNVLSVDQQLLQLTTSIAQQYDEKTITVDQAAGALSGSARTSALSAADIAWTDQLLADGEAGAVLISYLNGRGTVAPIEYAEVANALAIGQDVPAAIEYYRDAVNASQGTPLAQADALRSEAILYYNLGEVATGHTFMMKAASVYKGNSLTKVEIIYGVGLTLAADAWHEMQASNCKVGLAEWIAASKRLASVATGDSTSNAYLSTDNTSYEKYCVSGSTSASNR